MIDGWQDRLKILALAIRRSASEAKLREECEASARSEAADPRWGDPFEVLPYSAALSGLNDGVPAWYSSEVAQPGFNPLAGVRPEPSHRVVDAHEVIDSHRKTLGGS
ncbi:MAG: hypothetical protein ACLP9L_02335 [Thermoguttaceae bacterium]